MSVVAGKKVLVFVLAGGEGKRLAPLTLDRAKPAVPFGGVYRLVDFVLSNFANAGLLKMIVLTQYKSHSLDRHISLTWRFSPTLGSYVTSVPAQMRRGRRWFLGSADAVFQNFNLITDEQPDVIAVFGADHVYQMDPRPMIEEHIESGVGVTVAGIPVARHEGAAFGIMDVDEGGRITEFLEKPAHPPGMPGEPELCLASMGNYVFTTDALLDVLTIDSEDESSAKDLGGDVIPRMVSAGDAAFYDFRHNRLPGLEERQQGYWRDVGTIEAYYDAHLDLVSQAPLFNLYNDAWPMHSYQPPRPPAKLVRGGGGSVGRAEDSLVASGSIISGGAVFGSVLAHDAWVDDGAYVEDSILFDGVDIGAGSRIRRCIIDKGVAVPPGTVIGHDADEDRERFHVSDKGIVVIEKGFRFER